ncbi:MAG TPA: hypothetical protein VEA59_06855 [Patescibacteria group bacterium]|nr:hypothetical protein [Patescibacteria group bacterium]
MYVIQTPAMLEMLKHRERYPLEYQRYEWYGDAVARLAAVEHFQNTFPKMPREVHAQCVSLITTNQNMASATRVLTFQQVPGFENTIVKGVNQKILADKFEVYLALVSEESGERVYARKIVEDYLVQLKRDLLTPDVVKLQMLEIPVMAIEKGLYLPSIQWTQVPDSLGQISCRLMAMLPHHFHHSEIIRASGRTYVDALTALKSKLRLPLKY